MGTAKSSAIDHLIQENPAAISAVKEWNFFDLPLEW